MKTKSNFHNISFKDWLATAKSSLYAYSTEEDKENGIVSFVIYSTSLAELDGEEEGVLADFSYMELKEIFDDIKQATKEFNINFDNI